MCNRIVAKPVPGEAGDGRAACRHVLLPAEGSGTFLLDELRRDYPDAHHFPPFTNGERTAARGAAAWLLTDAPLEADTTLVFCRQALLHATEHTAPSINAWADWLFAQLPGPDQPWQLHVIPATHRCRLIRDALLDRLKRQRRHLLKQLASGPFMPGQSLVQLLLTAPERGWLSVLPDAHRYRRLVSAFPAGEVPVASDKAAPARAFAKLVEAEQRLGRQIAGGETCVDLGASPGSWSYVALGRGANVIAVDRAPLRPDLMRNPRLHFETGDAFKYRPAGAVDWLLCDVIAAPERSIALLLDWLQHRRCRQFVVTIKFKGETDYPSLDQLKRELPKYCSDWRLTRLCANKNEACAFGACRR